MSAISGSNFLAGAGSATADCNVDMVEKGLHRALCEQKMEVAEETETRRREGLGMVRRVETRRRERLRKAMTGLEKIPMRQCFQTSKETWSTMEEKANGALFLKRLIAGVVGAEAN